MSNASDIAPDLIQKNMVTLLENDEMETNPFIIRFTYVRIGAP